MVELKELITNIDDFPQKGVIFRDITTLFENPEGMKCCIDQLKKNLEGVEIDKIVAVESRGFILAAPLAYLLQKPLILARKKGKLPRPACAESYDLEYGSESLELSVGSIKKGDKVVVIDDLIATGGTILAANHLVENLGGIVIKDMFLIELSDLGGRQTLEDYCVESIITY